METLQSSTCTFPAALLKIRPRANIETVRTQTYQSNGSNTEKHMTSKSTDKVL